ARRLWSASVRATRLLLALTLLAGTLEAQAVRVRTIVAGSGEPAIGALVSLRNQPGRAVAQALADETGRAVLAAPGAGRYFVRVERIGFAGATSEPISLGASDTVAVTVVVPAGRVSLPDVAVSSTSAVVCKLDQKESALIAGLWTEARKALIGSEITRATRPPLLDVTKYERTLDARLQVADEQVSTFRTTSLIPFTTPTPEALSREGYLARTGAHLTFYAPDASVLLSEVFLGEHCFHVVPPARDPALIGLGFEPAAGRKLPDVRGVLWLDRASSELRFVEFGYTNLSEELRSGLEAGRVEFTRLANGGWIVSRWNLRVGHHEGGGEVAIVATEPVARASTHATVTGMVFDSLAGGPLADVIVSLAGGAYADTTDPAGLYRIEIPTEGDFVVSFAHARFQALGMPVVSSSARLSRGTTARVDFTVPGAEALTAAACRQRVPDRESEALVLGRLVDSLGQGAAGRVEARWAQVALLRPGYRTTIGERGMAITIYTDLGGRFRICGIPAGAAVSITGISQGRRASMSATPPPGSVVSADLTLH
ncbi:MAG: carboxypeptidase-like regulatory domain-containing protein, partial [Gemmatimonadota bacterium]